MNWEVYAYYDVDTLTSVFNAIVAIMGGSGFLSLLKTAALLGMLMAFTQMLFGKQFEGLHWFLGMFIVYGVLFIPRANVVIVDKTTSQPPAVVANVPLGLAFFGQVTSEVGDFLTTEYESNFSLPGDLKYQQHGLLFGNQLITESRRMVIADPNLRNDMFAFIRNCTTYDMLAGRIDPNDFSTNGNLWALMKNTSQARMTTLDNGATSAYCSDAWNILDQQLATYVQNAQAKYGKILNPYITSDAIAASTLASQLPNAYAFMMNSASSATDIIKQNMMINLSQEAGAVLGQQLNDPNAVQIALAQAQAQATANTTYVVMAKMAEDAMPKLKNLIEIIIYAVFPVVLIMMFMAGHHAGKVFKQYVMSLVWVQLWPPLYAITNFLVTNASAKHIQSLGMAASGLGIQSAADAGQIALSDKAIAGYMVVLIPVIATVLVKGGEMALSSLAGQMMNVQSNAAGTAGQQAATGNYSYDNVSVGNKSLNNDNRNSIHHQMDMGASPSQVSMTDTHGNQITLHGDGRTSSYVQASNSFVGQFDIGERVSSGLSKRASNDMSAAKDLTAKAASSMAATYSKALGNVHATTHGQNLIDTRGEGSQSGTDASFQTQTAMVNQLAQEFGLTRSDAARVLGDAAAGAAIDTSKYTGSNEQAAKEHAVTPQQNAGPTRPNDPKHSHSQVERQAVEHGQRHNNSARAGASVGANVSYETRLADAYKSVHSGNHQDMAANAKKFMTTRMHDTKFLDNHGVSDEDRRSIQADLKKSQSFAREADARLSEANRLTQEASYVKEKGVGAHYDPTKSTLMFKDIVQYASSNRLYGVRSEIDFMNITPNKQNEIVSKWAEDRNMMPKMSPQYLDGSAALTTKDEVRGKGNLDMMGVQDKGTGQVNAEWNRDQRLVPHTAGAAPHNSYQNIDQKINADKADVDNNRVQTEKAFNENAGDVIHTQFNDPNRNTMGPLTGANAPTISQTADAVGRSIESTVSGVENRMDLIKDRVGGFLGTTHNSPSQSHNGQRPGGKQVASRGEEGAGKKKEDKPTPQ